MKNYSDNIDYLVNILIPEYGYTVEQYGYDQPEQSCVIDHTGKTISINIPRAFVANAVLLVALGKIVMKNNPEKDGLFSEITALVLAADAGWDRFMEASDNAKSEMPKDDVLEMAVDYMCQKDYPGRTDDHIHYKVWVDERD